jgi:hypothetical protein
MVVSHDGHDQDWTLADFLFSGVVHGLRTFARERGRLRSVIDDGRRNSCSHETPPKLDLSSQQDGMKVQTVRLLFFNTTIFSHH